METPDRIFGNLFHDVQVSGIFTDSKTFVDCIPRIDPDLILEKYKANKDSDEFSLYDFVHAHFHIPSGGNADAVIPAFKNIEEHIAFLWDLLSRRADNPPPGSSLIPLPKPYIVPGGRFREIYYWDSYFTMLGLLESGRSDIVINMVENFGTLIDRIGHIPNGNRSYFISRSQPPFYPSMVQLIAEHEKRSVTPKESDRMLTEYRYWMDPVGGRTYALGDCTLNRYWDDDPIPRQESYREDIELADRFSGDRRELFLNIRAACESGWDFSSRWFSSPHELVSIRTTDLLPVDLNSLMSINEEILLSHKSNISLERNSIKRKEAIARSFWNPDTGVFSDYCISSSKPTDNITMAALFPLYAGIASGEQAASTIEVVEKELLRDGGWQTTNINSGQQWDAPNGWAPLQWIAFVALKNYGFDALAERGARQWIDNCIRVFNNTGKLVEKYNVVDTTLAAGGGEYPVQDGFGWSNGVLLRLMRALFLTE